MLCECGAIFGRVAEKREEFAERMLQIADVEQILVTTVINSKWVIEG